MTRIFTRFLKYIIIFIVGIMFSCNSQRKALDNSQNVSSFFKYHFSHLEATIDNGKSFSIDESAFIYLISFLSGKNINFQSYTGYPNFDKTDLLSAKKWYNMNMDKIKWGSVQRGWEILKSPEITDENITQLKDLIIE